MNWIALTKPKQIHGLRQFSGFTLLELVLTMLTVGVLVAIATPSMVTLIKNNRSDALAEELSVALQIARTEAIKRGERVSLCGANAAMTDCGGNWTDGWLVVTDNATTDGAAAVVVGEVIAQFGEPHEDSVISADNNGAVSFVRYTSLGELARIGGLNNTAPIVFTAYMEGCTGARQRQITVGVAGMMNVSKSECPGY
ncbi:GspH/FimT family pseudopilin [Gilvimarinus sp. SDUM040013]|uniref:Type II secretion system protein H n=1 Tax=Gilvimarinus gilvus TaxID=3058038 RepID=A0ABU4S2S0_9GAMM|nr:GspH/FimT family pseudopilin [Gilvimarinus sp. SDUM040013]MDO3384884.1 GspH/FimT family pseudopilin [Gilvimarinus sp. SDUM040013]MDX6850691.1 GspH/FimT family pseudopilin [Gilvimarinus sp. SDUM040013]